MLVVKYKEERLSIADYITLFNASLGMFSVYAMVQQRYVFGIALIFVSCLLDLLDGKVARLLGASIFGEQLDSLSDIIGFGSAPAIMMIIVMPTYWRFFSAFVWVSAGVLRLARYNVVKTPYFIGLPLPLAALGVTILLGLSKNSPVSVLGSLGLSYLMVSNIHVPKKLNGIFPNMGKVSKVREKKM